MFSVFFLFLLFDFIFSKLFAQRGQSFKQKVTGAGAPVRKLKMPVKREESGLIQARTGWFLLPFQRKLNKNVKRWISRILPSKKGSLRSKQVPKGRSDRGLWISGNVLNCSRLKMQEFSWKWVFVTLSWALRGLGGPARSLRPSLRHFSPERGGDLWAKRSSHSSGLLQTLANTNSPPPLCWQVYCWAS